MTAEPHGDLALRSLSVGGEPVTEAVVQLRAADGWRGLLRVGLKAAPPTGLTTTLLASLGVLAVLLLVAVLVLWPLNLRLSRPVIQLANDYAGLLANTSLYVVIEDEQRRIVHASDTFCRFFGADCVGKTTRAVLGVPESTLLEGEVELVVQGVPRTLHFVHAPLETVDGRPTRFSLVGTDVTDYRRAELERLRLAAALEGLDDVVLLVEDGRGVVYANPALLAQTGLVPGYVHGNDPVEVLAGDDEARALLRGRGRDSWRGRFVGRRVDGPPWQCALAIAHVEGAGFEVWVARDVSREADLEGQLRQSQKLEAIGQLAGGVAHDFNNLLTVVLSNTQVLLRDTLSEDQRESLQMIDEAGQRASQLTRQLLAFGRRQVLHVTEVDLGEVVTRATALLRRVIGASIELKTDVPSGLWPVRADAGQLEQVLMNLAINARDAMPSGGTLGIALSNATLEGTPTADGQTVPPGDYVVLRVADSGSGMSAETLSRAFEPFFTTKPAGRGTGLGLSTVLGIVRQSGAFIWVYSEPGRGSVFRIAFPRQRDLKAAPTASAAPVIPRGNGEHVLLVEDEPLVRRVMERMLLEASYRVTTAGHGLEALVLLDGGLTPDVVLSDVVMPRMGGLELREQLRARSPGLPVVLMSGYSSEVVELGGVDDSELLWKPPSRPAVLGAIRRALGRG
ncbi:MAG: ATP-binding protein [Myxococcota bacterium]